MPWPVIVPLLVLLVLLSLVDGIGGSGSICQDDEASENEAVSDFVVEGKCY